VSHASIVGSGEDQVGFGPVFTVDGNIGTWDSDCAPDRCTVPQRSSAVVMRAAIVLEEIVYELETLAILFNGEAFAYIADKLRAVCIAEDGIAGYRNDMALWVASVILILDNAPVQTSQGHSLFPVNCTVASLA